MPNKDVAVPLVFPDYLIAVGTPAVSVAIPDFLPGFDLLPARVKIPATKRRLPYLGHAGILFIDGRHGLTRYFEYGRYDPAELGLVRKQLIPDVKVSSGGRPTRQSLKRTLSAISESAGQGSRVSAAYIELDASAFIKMDTHAASRLRANHDPRREAYSLLSNSCLHFMKGVAEAGGAAMPPVLAPQPAGYIHEVRLRHKSLDYDRSAGLHVQDVPLD